MTCVKNICERLNISNLDAILITDPASLTYVTGMYGLEGVVLITATGKAFCFTDSRYIEAAQNSVSQKGFNVSTVDGNNYYKHINSICAKDNFTRLGFEDHSMTVREYKKASEIISMELIPASAILKTYRVNKNDFEAECIKKAQRIAEKAFDTLLGELKPGFTENFYKARLEYLMSTLGSEKPAFDTILISGKKTSMPHGVPGDNVINKGDFVTFDFGATVNGYKSDMTRTVAIGYTTQEMEKIYDIVLSAQLAAIEKAQIGVPLKDVDAAARSIISKAGYGAYFGHSTGHGVGLEVHEGPSVSPKSLDILQAGHVITIEPGIYIPDSFGVRIEDMLYFKADKQINLTEYPKKLIIL